MLKLWYANEQNEVLETQFSQQSEAFELAKGHLAEQYEFLASLDRQLSLTVNKPTQVVLNELKAFNKVTDNDMDLADLKYLEMLLTSVHNFELVAAFRNQIVQDVLVVKFMKWINTYRTISGLVEKLKRNGLTKLIKALQNSSFYQEAPFHYYLEQAILRYRNFFSHTDYQNKLLQLNGELNANNLANLFFEIGFVEFQESIKHLRLNDLLASNLKIQLKARTGIYDAFEFDGVIRKLWLTSRVITWLQQRQVQMVDPNDWQKTLTLSKTQLTTWHWNLVLVLQQQNDQVTCLTDQQKTYVDELGQLFHPATHFLDQIDYLNHTNWLYWLQKCQIKLTKALHDSNMRLLVYPHNDLIAWSSNHEMVEKIYQMKLQTHLIRHILN